MLYASEYLTFAPLFLVFRVLEKGVRLPFLLAKKMNDEARIADLLQPYLNNDQFYVVGIQVAGKRGGHLKVTVLVDSDVGITIDECVSISRQLGHQMDELNFFGELPFTLEVSSPGVDQPLTFRRQYVKNVGRSLSVMLQTGSVLTGKLVSVGDVDFVIDVPPSRKKATRKKEEPAPLPEGPQTLRFDAVQKANVLILFN